MTDMRADEDRLDDGDRLPWLEAVEDEEEASGPSAGKMIAFVLIGLFALGLIVGGLFWLREGGIQGGGDGEPELIAAPDGDYKVKAPDPGGMKVEGEGDTVFAASAGEAPKGQIDVSAVPEAPVAQAEPKAAPTPTPKAKELAKAPSSPPAVPAPAPEATASAGGQGGSIQLGAFSSPAAANAAWRALSGRFGYLAPLTQSVMPVTTGGRTLYRLRASGPGAADICGRLRVAGEQCVAL